MIRKNINDRQFIVYEFFSVSFFFIILASIIDLCNSFLRANVNICPYKKESPEHWRSSGQYRYLVIILLAEIRKIFSARSLPNLIQRS